MNEDLCFLPATEALALFRSKQLSPVELMAAQIAQSDRVEPQINAFSHCFFEQAMEQARASEVRYFRGESRGALDGLPVAIKDEVDVEGQPNTEGSLVYQHRIADRDAVLTARLRAQGAIFHARTTCPEFCSLFNTQSRLFGVTRNPWNLEVTPGGSSGGSGAALAAGTTTLASGSDIGGSIRFPASQCGIVGFKPPYGRVPETYSPYNLEPYCANGPMARTVADTALMQNVMSGPDHRDAASILPRLDIPLRFDHDLSGTRIAFTLDFDHLEIETDIVENTLDCIERLKNLGAEMVEVKLGWTSAVERAYNDHMDPVFFASLAKHMEHDRDRLCDYTISLAEDGLQRRQNPMAYHAALIIESGMYAQFGELMRHFDAFVCPTVMTNQLRADFNPACEDYVVNGKIRAFDLEISSCHYFNMMGRCPAISVPSGLGNNGVPTGLHIASRAFDDIAVFRVAAALESSWEFPFRAAWAVECMR